MAFEESRNFVLNKHFFPTKYLPKRLLILRYQKISISSNIWFKRQFTVKTSFAQGNH